MIIKKEKESIIIPLVNEFDEIIGSGEKMDVHVKGLLHRAFSVIIFNSQGEMLLHQRAFEKYHSPGLWTNACCGHPYIGEEMEVASKRRLFEEMGIDCELSYQFTFRYKADFDNGLTEHEIDHVYKGVFDKKFTANPSEVAAYKWLAIEDIKACIENEPESYTYWFKVLMRHL